MVGQYKKSKVYSQLSGPVRKLSAQIEIASSRNQLEDVIEWIFKLERMGAYTKVEARYLKFVYRKRIKELQK